MNTWAVPGYSETLELGSGASGRVVLAVHEETGVPVAVKYLSETLRDRPGFVHDFRAEARLLGGLESPYVAVFYEYVESPDGAAIVMELVDGVSLRALLARQGPLEPEAALVILKGSLLGLADAHRVGVVHRDYKPENVLVDPDGASKLVDFGIAVDTGTTVGVAGTPAYMAPEQWTGAPASPAADVYAATATFFECLTGRKPYTGDHLAELALQHVEAPVPAEDVPETVRDLVRRGLAKDPQERPAHAEEFVAELDAAAGAAYGPGWEERGRGRLAALVALLPLLLPSARSAPRTTVDTARTVLRPDADRDPDGGQGHAPDHRWAQPWRPSRTGALVSAAAVLLGILLTYGIRHTPGTDPQQAAQALATTSAQPGGMPTGPTATAPASASPSSSPTSTTSPGLSTSPSASTTADDPAAPGTTTPPTDPDTPPPGGTTPTTPATDTPPTTDVPAPTTVKDVAVSDFQQTGPTTATATLGITTNGTGPVTITVSWFTSNTAGQLGTPDGAPQTFERSGATQYTLTADHTFLSRGCYWAVQITTTPVSSDGGASQQLLTRQCEIG
ncbi:serine/threonine-protein kinase [Streptomyces sp. NPDC049627]|uniref:serine/threonine-protein kinase n=1 Tax=Streptomyces sp. NPDC049627 TaxID=3365595 RepID=UPI0037B61249